MWYIKKEYLAKFCQNNKEETDTNVTHTLTATGGCLQTTFSLFPFFFFVHPGQSPLLCVNQGEPEASSARAQLESSLKLLKSFHQNGR